MTAPTQGDILLVLHAHLPYVRYPGHEDHLEEAWLHEAILESYIPLIRVLEDLLDQGADFRLTFSLTPSLLEMLGDPLLMERFQRYIELRIDLAEKELFRTKNEPEQALVARMYRRQFHDAGQYFGRCRRDLIPSFRSIESSGKVEFITSAATHAFLPLHMSEPETIRTQLSLGFSTFFRHFGKHPAGLWLPECGYAPGLDTFIAEAGAGYTFVESHGVLNAVPKPKNSIYRPVRTPAGVVVYGRDTESAAQVWSSVEGYPGHADYRDFYRDIGFDLDYEYMKPYLPGGIRTFTGMKYFRVTGKTENKEIYIPAQGLRRARHHARHFLQARERQVLALRNALGIRPVITAAYDAELFGHWWYEGPEWLRAVLGSWKTRTGICRFVTPSMHMVETDCYETVRPAASSWGRHGYSMVWLDPSNGWIYRHLKKAAGIMSRLSSLHAGAGGLLKRALDQALRELLIAQSSDWPFMMHTGNAAGFAEMKFREHMANFFDLVRDISDSAFREDHLSSLERKNPIFRDIDFRMFARRP
ncbi:MAG TPA: 1,4-alpha-glucan branching protein domain-containing protein [Thermodesulfovibrionales bacterium]|nr:1,4-alpha-glucan branching protein domain-containing protein [Thermodesulfovibrionales bacterium]